MSRMLPVREENTEAARYQDNLSLVRERILNYVVRRLVPHSADFAHAEDIAQSCVVAIWHQYPEKQNLDEMIRIAIGVARHKIAQFHRDREKMAETAAGPAADAQNPHGGKRLIERISAREEMDRLLLGMLQLPGRCRELLRLKLIEQKGYAEIRSLTGISGNIYEIARRCFRTLLRNLGGPAV